MLKDNHEIDKLFSDKLGGFEPELPEGMWNKVKAGYEDQKADKKPYLWAVAASVLLLITFGFGYKVALWNMQSQQLVDNSIKAINHFIALQDRTKAEENEKLNVKIAGNYLDENKEKEHFELNISATYKNGKVQKEQNKQFIAKVKINKNKSKNHSYTKNNKKYRTTKTVKENQIVAAGNKPVTTPNQTEESDTEQINEPIVANNKEPEKDEKLIENDTIISLADNESELKYEEIDTVQYQIEDIESMMLENVANNENNARQQEPSWFVGGQFSAGYSHRNAKELMNESFLNKDNNPMENALMAYAGGINFEYQTGSRFSISSGVHYTRIGQTTDEFHATGSRYRKYKMNTPAGDITMQQEKLKTFTQRNELYDAAGNIHNVDADLIQDFEYIEIPIIAKYKVIDKKLGVSVLSGIGTNLLIGNNVFVKENDVKINVGETQNVNSINYRSMFGIGIDYSILENIQLSIEPTMKYSLNSISNDANYNYKPYTFAVFTGISYRF